MRMGRSSSHEPNSQPQVGRRRLRRRLGLGMFLPVVGLLLAACAGTSTPAASSVGGAKPVQGGTASFAMATGDDFSWIWPM